MKPILDALRETGYTTPTPIQEQAVPPALAGRDVLGCARTGTGKTCAFAAPILQRLSAEGSRRRIRALVVTPTRELALQIDESFRLYGRHLPLRPAVIFGGVSQKPQETALRRGVDILTATPGRLLDLAGQKLLDLSSVEILVLDEADRMLDMGFIHDVKRILKLLPEKRQTMLFSATMPPEVMGLVNELLHDYVRVEADPVSSPVEVIRQEVCFVDKGNKSKLLIHILSDPSVSSALVFLRTKHGANKVARELGAAGIAAAAIHGNKSQSARQAALEGFKNGTLRALVATDIAARGLDIHDLSHVVNYHLPNVPETYVHRIGRTGRAGKGGVAISFAEAEELPYLKDIEKLLGRKVPVREDNPYPMKNFSVPKDAPAKAAGAVPARPRRARAAGADEAERAKRAALKEAHREQDRINKENAVARKAERAAHAAQQEADAAARHAAKAEKAARPAAGKAAGEKRSAAPKPGTKRAARTGAPAAPKKAPAAKRTGPGRNAERGPARYQQTAPHDHQKDSTEQPSLMKPYYITLPGDGKRRR
ncbi:MAG TPA: DEAD/DEAH box helicase [Oscillospiraceae bacterium]|nr:DEAD/DEAH box helicase [Oscillospiraceae bacterium]